MHAKYFKPSKTGSIYPTQSLSKFVDVDLRLEGANIPRFVRDTIDTLSHVLTVTETNSVILNFDIVSLYTYNSYNLGKKAIRYWVEKKGLIP